MEFTWPIGDVHFSICTPYQSIKAIDDTEQLILNIQ